MVQDGQRGMAIQLCPGQQGSDKLLNMMRQTNRKSYRIARRAGQQGARHSVGNQAGGEKCTTGTNSAHPQASEGNHTEEQPQQGPLDDQSVPTKKKREKWQRDEYKQIMKAYYTAIDHPSDDSNTKQTYAIWRAENQNIRLYIDENKLANIRRDIVRNKRLTEAEIEQIKQQVNGNPIEPVSRSKKKY